MPVRIYFRGLILFRFPKNNDGSVKLLAELINDGTAAGQDDHQPEILEPGDVRTHEGSSSVRCWAGRGLTLLQLTRRPASVSPA